MTLMQTFQLALFMTLALAVSMFGLSVSVHFPSEHRSAEFRAGAGHFILFGSIVVAALALMAGVLVAAGKVPWYALVIGGGAMVLITPLILPVFSDRFVDGRGSLLAFAGAAVTASAVLSLT